MENYRSSEIYQIENRNFLSPLNYQLYIDRCPKVSFFSFSANIPSLELGTTVMPNYLRNIPIEGDQLVFGDFEVEFLVDENLSNYMEIQKWMRGIGFPESLAEIYDLQNEEQFSIKYPNGLNIYSDAILHVNTSSNTINFKVIFNTIFPFSLSELKFNSNDDDVEYLTAVVNFKYLMYNIFDKNGNKL